MVSMGNGVTCMHGVMICMYGVCGNVENISTTVKWVILTGACTRPVVFSRILIFFFMI